MRKQPTCSLKGAQNFAVRRPCPGSVSTVAPPFSAISFLPCLHGLEGDYSVLEIARHKRCVAQRLNATVFLGQNYRDSGWKIMTTLHGKKQRELLYQTSATTGPGLTPLFILCCFGWSCAASCACALEQIQLPSANLCLKDVECMTSRPKPLKASNRPASCPTSPEETWQNERNSPKKWVKLTMTQYINLMGGWMICWPQFST